MQADYDSQANAISIWWGSRELAEGADRVHPRAIAGLRGGEPIEVQLLYPDLGLEEPLGAVAERYDLDPGALIAAAEAAVAMPNQVVTLRLTVP